MQAPAKFLLIDDVSENRFLLAKTLLRKFPNAVVQECQDSKTSVLVAGTEKLSAIVLHRAADLDALSLIREIRKASAGVPIIMVSGRDTMPEAIAAGANAFLNYDAWLRIGTVVEEILEPRLASLRVGPK
jgi:DNA-binding response OmpR family regulator